MKHEEFKNKMTELAKNYFYEEKEELYEKVEVNSVLFDVLDLMTWRKICLILMILMILMEEIP